MWPSLPQQKHCIAGQADQPYIAASRTIASLWIFQSIVFYSIYTGNLIAFLSVTFLRLPFQTLKEMADQNDYGYGTWRSSIHEMLFQVARNTRLHGKNVLYHFTINVIGVLHVCNCIFNYCVCIYFDFKVNKISQQKVKNGKHNIHV